MLHLGELQYRGAAMLTFRGANVSIAVLALQLP